MLSSALGDHHQVSAVAIEVMVSVKRLVMEL